MWIRNKQFWSQTAQRKPSVKQSPCISPLKVEVEQCVVLLKRVFLQQTSSRPTTSCCYNKVVQGVYYVFLSKCYPYESYLLYGVYFCAKEHLCPHLLPQCLTEMTDARETGFQDKDQRLPAGRLQSVETSWPSCLWTPMKHKHPEYPPFHTKATKALQLQSTRLSEQHSFFCMCFLLALSLLQLAQCAGKRVILTGFFMSDVWSHQWKSLCDSWIGESCVLHVRGSVDDRSRSNILLKVQETCARSALKLCYVTISKKVYFIVAKIWRFFRSIFNDTSRVFLWQT